MAKYNLENYLDKDGLGFPLNFRRGNPNPLDNSSVWNSLAAAQNYAQTDPTAYVGQILSVVNYVPAVMDDEGTVTTPSQSTVEVYYIKDEAGALEPVGTSPVGDEGTITVTEDGTVSLYGIAGLALTREEEDGTQVNITYQPLYVNGKLTWVEPSATTVEGLAAEIEGLKTRISALETVVGGEESGLVKAVADLGSRMDAVEGDVDGINAKIGDVAEGKTVVQMIADAQEAATYDDTELAGRVSAIESDYLKGEHKTALEGAISTGDAQVLVDAKAYVDGLNTTMDGRVAAIEQDYLTSDDKTELSDAINTAEESAVNRVLGYLAEDEVNVNFDTLKEVAAWIESDTTASAELVTRVSDIEKDYLKGADKTSLQGEIDALETLVGALPEGATSSTVVAYIQEVVDGLKIGEYAKASELTALAGRVATLEGKMTAAEEAIEGINTALEGKVDVAEGYRLMSDAEGTKLADIEAGAQVNKIETVSAEFDLTDRHLSIAEVAQSKVTGLIAALEGKVDKVEGSRLLTSDEATKLEKLVLGENGEVSVSGKVAAGNVEGLDAWITARAGTLEGLSENNLTDALLAKLEGVAAGAQVNAINGVSDEFTIAADGKILNVKSIAQEKIIGLAETLEGKVNAVAGKGLSSNDLTDELLDKLNASQANVLEAVSVAGTLLSIVDKKVDIPVATEEAHGVVKSAAGENKVAVAADGTMEVNSLNANKLVQTDGEYLIMNGGSAAI